MFRFCSGCTRPAPSGRFPTPPSSTTNGNSHTRQLKVGRAVPARRRFRISDPSCAILDHGFTKPDQSCVIQRLGIEKRHFGITIPDIGTVIRRPGIAIPDSGIAIRRHEIAIPNAKSKRSMLETLKYRWKSANPPSSRPVPSCSRYPSTSRQLVPSVLAPLRRGDSPRGDRAPRLQPTSAAECHRRRPAAKTPSPSRR